MERDVSEWFTLPWRDGRNAAGLAVDTIYLLLPSVPRLVMTGGSPYRGGAAQLEDVVEDNEPRDVILHVLHFIEAYRDDHLEQWDLSGFPGPEHISRAYDAAEHYGRLTQATVNGFLQTVETNRYDERTDRWYAVARCVAHAIRVVQKWAANSAASGYAYNHFVEEITRTAMDYEPERVPLVVRRWRYRDASHNKTQDETHRIAFEKAWELGSYELAYKLMED